MRKSRWLSWSVLVGVGALGGLVGLASCSSTDSSPGEGTGEDAATDSGVGTEGNTRTDSGAKTDSGAGTDSGVGTDSGADEDAGDGSTDAGDVVVDAGDASADAGDASADAGDLGADAGSPSTLVFVMPSPVNHNWGSATTQDGTCQSKAQSAGLTGTWMAWLADSKTSPAQRFAHWTGDYVLTDKTTVIAHGWSGLTSGSLLHKIDRDPNGNAIAGGNVWTGTKVDGTYCGSACSDWSSAKPEDVACSGTTTQSSASWANYPGDGSCGQAANQYLYCFQQPETAKLVFVMPSPVNHNWGSATTQDGTCQSKAQSAGLTGTWMAWLADSKTSPAQRFAHWAGDYVLTDKTTVIAHGWSGLTSGSLLHKIDRDPNGNAIAGGNVWTGTKVDGTYCGSACSDWSSAKPEDVACSGTTTQSSASWANYPGDGSCGQAANQYLYCFQQ